MVPCNCMKKEFEYIIAKCSKEFCVDRHAKSRKWFDAVFVCYQGGKQTGRLTRSYRWPLLLFWLGAIIVIDCDNLTVKRRAGKGSFGSVRFGSVRFGSGGIELN